MKKERLQEITQIQRIIRDYYEQVYVNEMDNLDKMDRCLEKFNLLRLNQEETGILNKPITCTEIENVIKKKKKKETLKKLKHRA